MNQGEQADLAEAGRRLGLTRVRLTQILDLTLLAPSLSMGSVEGNEPRSERALRPVAGAPSWAEQRTIF